MGTSERVVTVLPVPQEKVRSQVLARVIALGALALTLLLVGRGVIAAYHAFTDSFVAPIILSPDSDSVIQSRMNLNRLLADRQSLSDGIAEIQANAAVDDEAIRLLSALLETNGARQLHAATTGQRAELESMLASTDKYLSALEHDLKAGLTHKVDLERQAVAAHQARASLYQNTRDQLSVREQLTRIELELLRRRADRRVKALQLESHTAALGRLSELIVQMQERPIFRAIEKSQNVAFVPYKEVEGVTAGAPVYQCKMWGYLDCSPVGTVAELVPGEVTAIDPWGSSSRGQYAILDLADASAARAKSLRVRPPGQSLLAGAQAPTSQKPR